MSLKKLNWKYRLIKVFLTVGYVSKEGDNVKIIPCCPQFFQAYNNVIKWLDKNSVNNDFKLFVDRHCRRRHKKKQR